MARHEKLNRALAGTHEMARRCRYFDWGGPRPICYGCEKIDECAAFRARGEEEAILRGQVDPDASWGSKR